MNNLILILLMNILTTHLNHGWLLVELGLENG